MAEKTQEGSFTSTLPGGKPLYFKVQTVYQTDTNGNPIRGSAVHTLKYNPGNGTYYPAATTTDFKTFDFKQYTPAEVLETGNALNSDPTILGASSRQSLQIQDGILNKNLRSAVASTSIDNGSSVGQSQAIVGSPQTLPNVPITPVAEDQESTSPSYPEAKVGEVSNLSINTALTSDNIKQILGTGPIIYPTNLGSNGQDFIEFEMVEYGTREFQTPVGSETTSFKIPPRKGTTTRLSSVYLPIQPSINDQNDIGWGEEKMNVFQAVLANIATTGSGAQLGSDLDKVGEIFGSNNEYEKIMRRYIGGQAVGINPIARTDGLVLNPNLELLFSGPSLRPFNFTFRLSPRDQTEADTVKKIIKFFKLGSVVRTTNDGLFLKAPYVFNIKYKFKSEGSTHPGLNKIKTCALRTINVNYTPDGSYMTFEDGTMTSYEMALQFCELEPVYDSDYASDKTHPIGF